MEVYNQLYTIYIVYFSRNNHVISFIITIVLVLPIITFKIIQNETRCNG